MTLSGKGALLGTVAVLGAAAAGWWWFNRDVEDEDEGPDLSDAAAMVDVEGGQLSQGAQRVVGVAAVRDTFWIEVESKGRSQANRSVTLRAQADGVATRVAARENQYVRAGQLLVTVDTTEYALDVTQAESDLLRAEADYRQMTIGDDQIEDPALREERDRNALARSGLEQARVALRQARLRLSRTRVVAPFNGVLANVAVVQDQWISSGTEIVTILEPHPLRVETQVLEGEIGKVVEGRSATVTFAAFPDETLIGTVASINPLIDPELKTGRVTVLVPNPDLRIKAGMSADVLLSAEALPDRLIIPKAALLERGEGLRRFMVFVYEPQEDGGIARQRFVNPGRESGTHVEIVSDGPETGMIEAGEIVLVDGHHFLGDRVAVTLVDDTGNGGAG